MILLSQPKQEGGLAMRILQLVCSMSESGLTEVSHYISNLDI